MEWSGNTRETFKWVSGAEVGSVRICVRRFDASWSYLVADWRSSSC